MNGSGSGNLNHFFARFRDLIWERNHFFPCERERELNHFFRELPIPWYKSTKLKSINDFAFHFLLIGQISFINKTHEVVSFTITHEMKKAEKHSTEIGFPELKITSMALCV